MLQGYWMDEVAATIAGHEAQLGDRLGAPLTIAKIEALLAGSASPLPQEI